MRLTNILLSQSVRLFRTRSLNGGGIYGLDLVRGLESRYGFFEVPRTLSDFDLSKGVTFLHGHLHKRFVIDKFQVFENGVLAETRATVEQCDEFLDDLISWTLEEMPIIIDENAPRGNAYLSQVEIEAEMHLNETLLTLSSIGLDIAQKLDSYGQHSPEFRISGIRMHTDVSNFFPLKPVDFSIERRSGAPYTSNLYFSSAPLKTADHMNVLNQLEILLSE